MPYTAINATPLAAKELKERWVVGQFALCQVKMVAKKANF
jgi:hypothetical protein